MIVICSYLKKAKNPRELLIIQTEGGDSQQREHLSLSPEADTAVYQILQLIASLPGSWVLPAYLVPAN